LVGDVLKSEEYPIRAFTLPIDPTSVGKHPFSPNAWECVIDLEIIEVGILEDNFHLTTQCRNIPLVVAYVKDKSSLSLFRRRLEGFIEGTMGCLLIDLSICNLIEFY